MAQAVTPPIYQLIPQTFAIRRIPSDSDPEIADLVEGVGSLAQNLDISDLEILNRPEKISDKVLGEALLSIFVQSYINDAFLAINKKVGLTYDEQALFNDQLPTTINANLRDYQKRGFTWMMRNAKIGLGYILADDMGLGKTLQVLSVMDALRHSKDLDPESPALIIVPKTLLTNWLWF